MTGTIQNWIEIGTALGVGTILKIAWDRYATKQDKKEDKKEKKIEEQDSFWKLKYEEAEASKRVLIEENKEVTSKLSDERAAHAITQQKLKVALTIVDEAANTDLVKLLTGTGNGLED